MTGVHHHDRKLRLGVDARCFSLDGAPGAGVAHAARALIAAMEENAEQANVEMRVLRVNSGLSLAREAAHARCDALFVPSGAVSPFVNIPAFPWVHDLDIFDHSEWFPQRWLRRQCTTRLFLRGLRRAPKIFCVSEHTKRSIERIAEIDPCEIVVTNEGVLPHPLNAECSSLNVLLFGTVEPRKNIPFIIALWPEVCRRLGRTVTLTIAGKDGWGHVAIDESLPWVKRKRNVSDEDADALFADAACVLTPSLSEGFGRTALEAMARGTPVIASHRGALSEVVGEAGLLLDPQDAEAWTNWIVRLFEDEDLRRHLAEKGKERAARFPWHNVAHTILEEIKALC